MDKDLLANLTAQYGEIFREELGGQEFYFRALTLEEVTKFSLISDTFVDLEDIYVSNAVVYPFDFDLNKIKAGFVTSLANSISIKSGLKPEFIIETLEKIRTDLDQDILFLMKAVIITAMPTYTDEYLDSLTITQLLKKLVLAEKILSINQEVSGIEAERFTVKLALVDSEVKKPKEQQASKEELLRRIRKEQMETINPSLTNPVDQQAIDGLDEELLTRALGYVKSDDPIAKKLMQGRSKK